MNYEVELLTSTNTVHVEAGKMKDAARHVFSDPHVKKVRVTRLASRGDGSRYLTVGDRRLRSGGPEERHVAPPGGEVRSNNSTLWPGCDPSEDPLER